MKKKRTRDLSHKKRFEISDHVAFFKMIAKIIWFLGVSLFLAIFVKTNWTNCVDFTYITGYNILFIVFIIILLLPLINGVKLSALGAGVEMTSKTDSTNNIITLKTEQLITEVISESISKEVLTKDEAILKKEFEKELQEMNRNVESNK